MLKKIIVSAFLVHYTLFVSHSNVIYLSIVINKKIYQELTDLIHNVRMIYRKIKNISIAQIIFNSRSSVIICTANQIHKVLPRIWPSITHPVSYH